MLLAFFIVSVRFCTLGVAELAPFTVILVLGNFPASALATLKNCYFPP